MTLVNTDLHPSHNWVEHAENDFRYFVCDKCWMCSCCYVEGRVMACDEGWAPVDKD